MLKFTAALAAAVLVLVCAVLVSATHQGHIHKAPALHNKKDIGSADSVWAQMCSAFGSTDAAAGVMGNVCVESAGTYNYQIHQEGGGNGYGLFQFDFLRSYYFKWLSSTGRSDSAESQITFVHESIYGNQQYLIGAGKASELRAGLGSGNVVTATETFSRIFEAPGIEHLRQPTVPHRCWPRCRTSQRTRKRQRRHCDRNVQPAFRNAWLGLGLG